MSGTSLRLLVLLLENFRSWLGSLEENQDGVTDLHTDAIFASPAFEVILNQSPDQLFREGFQTARQGGSSLFLSSRFSLQRLHLWGGIRCSKSEQWLGGARGRHSLHFQERRCLPRVAKRGTGQNYQRHGQGMDILRQRSEGVLGYFD